MASSNPLENGDSHAYWEGAREGRLLFQKCSACGHVQFPPRHQCATCWNSELEQIQSTGRGEIESITVVRRAPIAAFRDRVPYAVASILVEEGPRMITNIVGAGALEAVAGDAVMVTFEAGEADAVLPQFRLAR